MLVQGHEFLNPAMKVIFVTESNLVLAHRHQPVVADSNLMTVPANVFKHLFGTDK